MTNSNPDELGKSGASTAGRGAPIASESRCTGDAPTSVSRGVQWWRSTRRLSPSRAARLTSALARIVAALLRGIVAAAGLLAAGLGQAYTQIVSARGRGWRRFLAAHAADASGIAELATLASHLARFFR